MDNVFSQNPSEGREACAHHEANFLTGNCAHASSGPPSEGREVCAHHEANFLTGNCAHSFPGPSRMIETGGGAPEILAEAKKEFGFRRAIVVAGKTTFAKFGEKILGPLRNSGCEVEWYEKNCDVSRKAITGLLEIIEKKAGEATAVIGLGGGKAMDLAKSVRYAPGIRARIPLILVPTSPSTCAAYSSHIVVYSENGECEKTLVPAGCADLLALDASLLTDVPERLLSSGIADAMAKFIESRHIFETGARPDTGSATAFLIARSVYDFAVSSGVKALSDLKDGMTGSETLLSCARALIVETGLVGAFGGLKCRADLAHAIGDALTHVSERGGPNDLHGLRVGYGLLVQLAFEERDEKEILYLADLFDKLNVPGSLGSFEIRGGYDRCVDTILDMIFSGDSIARRRRDVLSRDKVRKAVCRVEALTSKGGRHLAS